jgi:hypothetical protein
VLLTVAVVIAVVAGEVALRIFSRTAPQLELDIYRKQNGMLLLRPNIERRHVTRYWDVRVRTNSEGWRDGESNPGLRTVRGLGDSFAFDWGVELEESFYSLIERGLTRRERIELIQARVSGSSTLDQEKLLDGLISHYRPEVVALAFFVGNDFTETGLGGAERLRVTDGLLELKPMGEERVAWSAELRRWLTRKSRILQLLRAVQFDWQRTNRAWDGPPRTWDGWMREFAQIHLCEPSPMAKKAIRETLASLGRIAERCRRDGIELVVIVLPRSFQVDANEREEMGVMLGIEPDAIDIDKPQRLLAEWSSGSGVPVVDLLEEFRERHADGARLYYSTDAHMTPAGHQAVADIALPELQRLVARGKQLI